GRASESMHSCRPWSPEQRAIFDHERLSNETRRERMGGERPLIQQPAMIAKERERCYRSRQRLQRAFRTDVLGRLAAGMHASKIGAPSEQPVDDACKALLALLARRRLDARAHAGHLELRRRR